MTDRPHHHNPVDLTPICRREQPSGITQLDHAGKSVLGTRGTWGAGAIWETLFFRSLQAGLLLSGQSLLLEVSEGA